MNEFRKLYECQWTIDDDDRTYLEDAYALGWDTDEALQTLAWARRQNPSDPHSRAIEQIRRINRIDAAYSKGQPFTLARRTSLGHRKRYLP